MNQLVVVWTYIYIYIYPALNSTIILRFEHISQLQSSNKNSDITYTTDVTPAAMPSVLYFRKSVVIIFVY